jgi:two-component system, NtrC family, response regulator
VTLLDLGLPPRPNDPDEGLAVLSAILALDPLAKVIVVSGQGEKAECPARGGAGAYDFLCKPVDMDELGLVLQRCVYVAELEQEYRACSTRPGRSCSRTCSAPVPRCRPSSISSARWPRPARPVLILGESGTGKEMVARAIHRRSAQKGGPFVAINCNAIPENLLESELFGHEKGAFTGAHAQRKGHIETAAGGTLFLDEIGELPAAVQVKLLRFLQEKTFQRVGGRQEIPSDTRVIAATNKNLEEQTASGKFREDLYFRLAVMVVKVPALAGAGGRHRPDGEGVPAKATAPSTASPA